jgi:hypothetical protein
MAAPEASARSVERIRTKASCAYTCLMLSGSLRQVGKIILSANRCSVVPDLAPQRSWSAGTDAKRISPVW